MIPNGCIVFRHLGKRINVVRYFFLVIRSLIDYLQAMKLRSIIFVILGTLSISVASASEEELCALKRVDMSYSTLLGGVGYRFQCGQNSEGFKKAFCYSADCKKEFLNEVNQTIKQKGYHYLVDAFSFKIYSRDQFSKTEKAALRVIERDARKGVKAVSYQEKVTFYRNACFSSRCSDTIQVSNGNVERLDFTSVNRMASERKCKIFGTFTELDSDAFHIQYHFCLL